MKKKPKEPIAPIDCRTDSDVCSIHRDNLSTKHGWAMVDAGRGTVTICQQQAGEAPSGSVTLPRGEMKRLVAFLTTPQKRTAV